MNLHDTWTSLRHGGNLLSVEALDGLPKRPPAPPHLADSLRAALVALPAEGAGGEPLSALLDVVLEGLCGLAVGWRKGSSVGAADAEKLLDGTVMKPRRVFEAPDGDRLVVFTTPAQRVGVGAGRRPVAQVVEYLRRRGLAFGLLTNGREWRFVWADTDGVAWVEWDADRWLDADLFSAQLDVFRRVVSWPALARGGAPHSPLLAAIRDTRRGQAKLSKELGERVRRSVETLLRARAPVVAPAWDDHAGTDLYVAACHVVMRLVVVLFAEARELLPVDNPVYHQAYGLRGLLDQLDRLTPERRRARQAAWPRLLALFRLLHAGSPHPALAVPAYGGDLFKVGDTSGDGVQRALALLEAVAEPPDDDAIHRILVLLTRTEIRVREGATWRKVAAPVDFTELTSEYIGILYEGLLDYELRRAGAEPIVFLALGDQPALPLDRLEGMDEKTLAALVEKAKVKKAAAEDEDEGDDEAGDEGTEADEDAAEAPPDEEPVGLTLDDSRAAARARAVEWGRRAARAGKLVKKGKPTDPAYLRDLDAAANQLIADVKLPGELFLVRWGGTRKGAGTFYTRPQLTMPTVRRTLEPLLYQGEGEGRVVRTPEEILALKVCDPAMGSGSFLVAALRTLTAALVESLHVHGRLSTANGGTTIQCEAFPEADRALPASSVPGAADERLDALARRAVVEHCLYGVDLDPLAVELGRVALWVETLDKRLPFTFLDHKLRCGNALIGTWLDRFRDYPLLAFDRESPDRRWRGVHHPADAWAKALKAKRDEVVAEQAALLGGQVPIFPGASDEELKAATDRVRRLYRELRAVPAGRPDERARIWRERIQADPALVRVREAFDTWCALWFWPLGRIGEAPGPRSLHAPSPAARETVKAVRDRVRFFHWELEFPDVFTELGAGFSAVVGNPPWEIQKPNSKEFFSNLDPLYRAYGKQEALGVQRRLFEADDAVEHDWLAYNGDFKDRGNFVRYAAEPFGDGKIGGHEGDVALGRGSGGDELQRKWRARRGRFAGTSDPAHPFRHQGSADLNTYKMFVEVGHALLQKGGQIGVVVPSGLYTDKGTGELRKLLLDRCAWRWLYGFENRTKIFDIDSRFKFCVCIAQKGGRTEAIQAAFMRHDLEDWAGAVGMLEYPAERVRGFSPKSLSVLEIRSERDLAVLSKLYANGVLLGDEGPDGWGIKYGSEFHMTNDSHLFVPRDKAEADGFVADAYGRWVRGAEVMLPLIQGIMLGSLEFNRVSYVDGRGLAARWTALPPGCREVRPQFVMDERDARTKLNGARPRVGFRPIARTTDQRTLICSVVPGWPAGNSVGVLEVEATSLLLPLAAALNAYCFDWQLRGRQSGSNVNWFLLAETASPKTREAHPLGALSARLYPQVWLASAAPGRRGGRPALTPHERLRLRCMLDAIVAVLYGLDRDDFAWILRDCDHPAARLSDKAFCRTLDPKGFWRVDKTQDPELRHTVLSLAAFDDLQRAIAAAGSRDAGIQAFCDQHDGDGWMLPETLGLADLGLTRSVDVGTYDDRARTPQPVRARVGERFLDWQLAQTPEESWAECERHARAILLEIPAAPEATALARPTKTTQVSLFSPRTE
jgi:hypothetical protein